MKRPYLILINDNLSSRAALTTFLDEISEVSYWYACMPNAVFLISSLSASGLSHLIRDKFGTDGLKRHIVTEVSTNRDGWMPKQVWHMFRNFDSPKMPKS
jgi:hypothetical protein